MIVIMASLTTYLESFMLIMMSEHLSISIPQMDGFKMFLIPLLIRIVLFTAVIAISVITVLQRTEKENQRKINHYLFHHSYNFFQVAHFNL